VARAATGRWWDAGNWAARELAGLRWLDWAEAKKEKGKKEIVLAIFQKRTNK
jgi:hypothetical protein